MGEYVEKRKALAMSLATFASGLGAMFPPVMLYLFEQYGYSGALLIIAAISLHCCVGGILYRPLSDNFKGKRIAHVEMKPIKPSISNGSLSGTDHKREKKTLPMLLKESMESLHSLESYKEDTLPITEEENKLNGKETDGERKKKLLHSTKMIWVILTMTMKMFLTKAVTELVPLTNHHQHVYETEKRAYSTNQIQSRRYLILVY